MAVRSNSAPQDNTQPGPDIAIVAFGEKPYAEGEGDLPDINFSRQFSEPLQVLRRLRGDNIPTVSVLFTGRPLWVNPELNASSSFVVAWLPGTEGSAMADVLFADSDGTRRYDFAGRLPFSLATPSEPGTVRGS